jgi:tetratricopeptide (TPR) repeat protein
MRISFAFFLLCSALVSQASADELWEAGQIYLKGDFRAAVQKYTALVEMNPGSEEARLGLVRSRWKQDDVAEAYESCRTALSRFPSSSPLYAAMGDIYFRMGRLKNALDSFKKAMELDRKNARAYFGMSKLHSFDFNRKSARRLEIRAYECDPDDPEIMEAYARGLPAEEEIALLEKYLRLAENEPDGKKNSITDYIAFLKYMESRPETWELQDPAQKAEIGLSPVYQPRTGRTGYIVTVLLNGVIKAKLHLDTGSRGILIDEKAVADLNLETVSPCHIGGLGDSEPQLGKTMLAQSVRIGPIEFHNCPLTVAAKKLFSDADGIMGIDVFRQFLITLDFPDGKLKLSPLPPVGGASADPKSWRNLDRTVPREMESYAPIGSWGNLVIPTLVNKTALGYFFLDTGASESMLSLEMAKKFSDLLDMGKTIRGVSGFAQAYLARDITLQIGHFSQNNETIPAIDLKDMSHRLGFEISGFLGHSLLKYLVITIDLRAGLIDFQYPDANAAKNRSK